MLIDFAVTNYRSIKERQVFSMQTVSRIGEKPDNTISSTNANLLRSAVMYGRNASGKSNLLSAMDSLSKLVINENHAVGKEYVPFKICLEQSLQPIVFEINFIASDNVKYNYYLSFHKDRVVEEKLYHYPEGRQARLYIRKENNEIITDISILKEVIKNTHPYHTLLSRLNLYKIDSLSNVFLFFERHFVTQSFIGDENSWTLDLEILQNSMPYHISNLEKLLKIADTGISSVTVHKTRNTKTEDSNQQSKKIKIRHPIYENNKEIGQVTFDLEEESAGTKKLLLFGSYMLICLYKGYVLIVDELDKGLHPGLMQAIIKIFNNPKTNPNNAQLIFSTHDVSLLSADLFRRDQIWITEKDIEGASSYYSLADIKGVRADIPFEKYLLKGAFGGIPVINEFDFEFNLKRNE